MKVNGQPLVNTKTYTLTTTSFVALDGGDGYSMLKNAKVVIAPDQAPIDVDVVKKAITSVAAIAPKVEGRIKRLDTAGKSVADCK